MTDTPSSDHPQHQSTRALMRRLIRECVRPYVGWLAFAERLGALEIAGAALVCLAIVLSRSGGRGPVAMAARSSNSPARQPCD